MKYSLIMPYFDRYKQFRNTLVSFRHFYGNRSDFEIIIVEDKKNILDEQKHKDLMSLINGEKNIKIRRIEYNRDDCYNPSEMFNIAVAQSKAEYVVLTNPEIMHEVDVLGSFDLALSKKPNEYLICWCKSIKNVNDIQEFKDLKYNLINPGFGRGWYIHPQWNKRYLHFCSVIERSIFNDIGGFDEEYIKGIGFEDNDFVRKIQSNNIDFRLVDFIVLHQDHDKQYSLKGGGRNKKLQINKSYFNAKWKGKK